jgi:hypothetical protein
MFFPIKLNLNKKRSIIELEIELMATEDTFWRGVASEVNFHFFELFGYVIHLVLLVSWAV